MRHESLVDYTLYDLWKTYRSRRVIGRERALLKDNDSVCDGENIIESMAHKNHHSLLFALTTNQLQNLSDLSSGKCSGRFVEEENFRIEQYRSCDGDGLLHFRGRVDFQIKHMGYRIELEEVEAAFSALRTVHEVGVIYKAGAPGLPGSILAYVNAGEGSTAEGLAAEVAKALPAYMRPRTIFVQHSALPKNSNGKIDRQALKALAQ